MNNLTSWREIITPHDDVMKGVYKNSDFAIDLAQSTSGEGRDEYSNPNEFFSRTYLTSGMKGLLLQAAKRVTNQDGDPVMQIKTAFGGGKTHSMLALYHFMRSGNNIKSVREILDEAKISALPRVNIAVLVGTALNVSEARVSKVFPDIKINTFWGEMAAQLAESSGDKTIFERVRKNDEDGTSPGSQVLREIFDSCGPCLILMDEIVAYGRKLNDRKLSAGTFGNFITFIQELTEAARTSKNSLIAASIPESDMEVADSQGKEICRTIEKFFGRIETIYNPVEPREGFEVVRRRLFKECANPEARDITADSFSKFYRYNKKDFPFEASELSYKDRIISCYPIHPEIFDRLYKEWSTLENFQRTRGVLRFMASVIYNLWDKSDSNALIMPGSIDFSEQNIRTNLIKSLSSQDTWSAIIDNEVDGLDSIPRKNDREITRYGKDHASIKIARAIMLGSAPSSPSQQKTKRGIDSASIRLGVIQPGENISVYNDALNTLRDSLAYLYSDSDGNNFWYDTRPTLRKTVDERASQVDDLKIDSEIIKRLGKMNRGQIFSGVHVCPDSAFDVTDEQRARLVILPPSKSYNGRDDDIAKKFCLEIMNDCGRSPRMHKNMLVFLAPDSENLEGLRKIARFYIAWRSISDDREILNLDSRQIRETQANIKRYDDEIMNKLCSVWIWLLVPSLENGQDLKNLNFERYRISNDGSNLIERTESAIKDYDLIYTSWAPENLRFELDKLLWDGKNDICVKTLWDCLTQYCYLPKLAKYSVLETAIKRGLESDKYFALADSKDSDGKYINFRYNFSCESVNKESYLVKPEFIPKPEESKPQDSTKPEQEKITTPEPEHKTREFYLTAKLDPSRFARDFDKIKDEIIPHLMTGGSLEISVNIDFVASDEISGNIQHILSENCKALGHENFRFVKE
ncbi:MAG: ATP-binding protein [Synergistaceae bacterium]|nr:ATP-binding protein [Synergistaceae bacterium]